MGNIPTLLTYCRFASLSEGVDEVTETGRGLVGPAPPFGLASALNLPSPFQVGGEDGVNGLLGLLLSRATTC